MDKDRVKGKVKDISGRVQRQAGEWTGDEEAGESTNGRRESSGVAERRDRVVNE